MLGRILLRFNDLTQRIEFSKERNNCVSERMKIRENALVVERVRNVSAIKMFIDEMEINSTANNTAHNCSHW